MPSYQIQMASNFNLLTLNDIESLGDLVTCFDVDQNVSLYHYHRCNATDSDTLKTCRGVVFDRSGNNVLQTYPYTPELSTKNVDEIKQKLTDSSLSNYRILTSFEGTVIRVFHFNNTWYVATHKKLNAFKSRWGSKETFGEIFDKALENLYNTTDDFKSTIDSVIGDYVEGYSLEKFFQTLNPTHKYLFLIRNTSSNRIVSLPPNPEFVVYHVGTIHENNTFVLDDILIPHPDPVTSEIKTVDELITFVHASDPLSIQGVVLIGSTLNDVIKIVSEQYIELASVRGNEPSVKYRYLQLRLDPKMSSLFVNLYSDRVNDFKMYEGIITTIATDIYNAYVNRFIRKQFTVVPKEQHTVLQKCHKLYLENRDTNKISFERVWQVLNAEPPSALNHMIRQYVNV